MAQELQTINLVAPGFKGINTEDSPLAVDANFALVADNCVIDRYGRIATRKGYEMLTNPVGSPLTAGAEIEVVHVYRNSAGDRAVLSCGEGKIFRGEATLTDITPGSYTITSNNWKVLNFNNSAYFFQTGQEPLVYTTADGLQKMSDVTGYSGTAPQGNDAIAAWGRLWAVGTGAAKSTIFWSDLLQGHKWTGGSSGSIDVTEAWPDGYDEIIALAAHNNFLVIFGRHSIVVYAGAEDPSTMELSDTVAGVGIRCRCGLENTGTDLLFLSYEGLRSFGRTIQEKSMPIGDLSRNIKQDLLSVINAETQPVRTCYSPENRFLLIIFRSQNLAYCFDTQGTLENGSYRVTRWPDYKVKAMYRDRDGTLLIGAKDGIGKYEGYTDNGAPFQFTYYSPNLTFGDASRLKLPKKLRPTVIGGAGATLRFKWGFDFTGSFRTAIVQLSGNSISQYAIDEFGVGVYSAGIVSKTFNINTSGSGGSVVVGLEALVDGSPLSLQEYNIWTLLGRLI